MPSSLTESSSCKTRSSVDVRGLESRDELLSETTEAELKKSSIDVFSSRKEDIPSKIFAVVQSINACSRCLLSVCNSVTRNCKLANCAFFRSRVLRACSRFRSRLLFCRSSTLRSFSRHGALRFSVTQEAICSVKTTNTLSLFLSFRPCQTLSSLSTSLKPSFLTMMIAMLVESGDVALLQQLTNAGRFPEGFAAASAGEDLSPAYLAIAYDRPEMLKFLAANGVDLHAQCDDYATPAFYAVYNGKIRCLETLVRLGVDCRREPCTKFGETCSMFLDRHQQPIFDLLVEVLTLRDRAADQIKRWLRRFPNMGYFRAVRAIVIIIQRRWRALHPLTTAPAPAPCLIEGPVD